MLHTSAPAATHPAVIPITNTYTRPTRTTHAVSKSLTPFRFGDKVRYKSEDGSGAMKTLLALYTRVTWVLERFVAPLFWLLARGWLAYSILQINPGKLALVFAALLALGLAGRFSALALLYCIVFNTLSMGTAEQLLLLGIVLQGSGMLALDTLLRRKVRRNILDVGPLTRAMKRSHKRF